MCKYNFHVFYINQKPHFPWISIHDFHLHLVIWSTPVSNSNYALSCWHTARTDPRIASWVSLLFWNENKQRYFIGRQHKRAQGHWINGVMFSFSFLPETFCFLYLQHDWTFFVGKSGKLLVRWRWLWLTNTLMTMTLMMIMTMMTMTITCWHICRCPELNHGLACPAPRWDGELLGTW